MLAKAAVTTEALVMASLLLAGVVKAQVAKAAAPWGASEAEVPRWLDGATRHLEGDLFLGMVLLIAAVAGALAMSRRGGTADCAGSKPTPASKLLGEKKRETPADAGDDLDSEACKAMLAAGDEFLRVQCDLALDLLGQMEKAPSEVGSTSTCCSATLQERLDNDLVEEFEAQMASRAPEYEATVDSLYDSLELPEFRQCVAAPSAKFWVMAGLPAVV